MRGAVFSRGLGRHVTLILLGAASIWCWWQVRGLGDVRLHLGVFYAIFAMAFLCYLTALWAVRSWEQAAEPWRARGVALSVVVVAAALARVALLETTPSLSDDIYRYRWDGRVQLAGLNPYVHPPSAPALAFLRDPEFSRINFPQLRTVYPPLTELAFRLGAALNPALTAQKRVFVLAEIFTLLSLLSILRRRGRSSLWVVAYAWHPLIVLEFAGSGHNDALGIAAMWLGLASWEARRWAGVALGWSAGFLSKFASVILLPWWWCRCEGRGWLAACVALAIIPLCANVAALGALAESLSAMTVRFASNASCYLVFAWVTQSPAIGRLLSAGLAGAFLVWWARRQADPTKYVLGALSALVLLSPVVHPWYLTWLIPCFCFWRVPAIMALTGTAVLSYTEWPGYLAGGPWVVPPWAQLLEYGPVLLLGLWGLRRVRSKGWGRFEMSRGSS